MATDTRGRIGWLIGAALLVAVLAIILVVSLSGAGDGIRGGY